MTIKRGDIFYVDLGEVTGSEQGGLRPAIIIQNNVGNTYSPTVIVATITSKLNKAHIPTHVKLFAKSTGLSVDSLALLEQVRTIDKSRLCKKCGKVDSETLKEINKALAVSLGLK